MPGKFMLKTNCLLHPSCRESITINGIDICHECWSNASKDTCEKIEKVTHNYYMGLLTPEELHSDLTTVTFDAPELMSSQEPEVEV